MSNHNNIYNILNKLSTLEPKPAPQPEKKTLIETKPLDKIVQRLNESYQKSAEIKENGLQRHIGIKKYGKEGFEALQKAGRDGASEEEKGRIKDKYLPKEAVVTEAFGRKEAIDILANIRATAKQAESSRKPLPPGFANQLINDLYEVILYIEKVAPYESKMTESDYCDACDRPADQCVCDEAHDDHHGHDPSEYDQEGEMAHSDLNTAEDAIEELKSLLSPDANLPEWVQAKITKAVDYLDTARDYTKSNPPEEGVAEAAKPDFLDVDDDGNKEEPFKKAVKDKEGSGKGKVEEGVTIPTKTGLIHKGTYGNSYQPDEDDPEDDAPAEPKKKGRPAKNKGPERVTSKAWKHKGGRKVSEAIKLDTYVEDTMAEIRSMFVAEKAVSQQQQKFMGMVHAMQKGEKVKGASPELKKVASTMKKSDAKDFAKTKHKGLPKKVSESLQLLLKEGVNFQEMMRDQHSSVQEMLEELMAHCEEYKRSGYMHDALRDALDIHRHTKKLSERDLPPPGPAMQETTPMGLQHEDHELNHLAKLAGVGRKHSDGCNMSPAGQHCPVHGVEECWGGGMMESSGKKPDADGDGIPDWADKNPKSKGSDEDRIEEARAGSETKLDDVFNEHDFYNLEDVWPALEAGDKEQALEIVNRYLARGARRAHWKYLKALDVKIDPSDPENSVFVWNKQVGMGEGNAFTGKLAQTDKGDTFSLDGKTFKDTSDLDECGDDMMGGGQRDGVNVSSNFDTRTGNKNLTVSAEGDAAEELANILKSAGLMGGERTAHDEPGRLDADMQEEYANEPEEDYVDTDSIVWQGADLNRPKSQHADKPKAGDNPLATEEVKLESRLQRMYDSIKIKTR